MSNVDSSQISCILSTATVEELYLLWQKTSADDKRGYLLIEDQTIADSFALLISQKGDLSVLLQTTIEPPYPSNGHQLDPLYQVFITWNADEINNFIESKNLPTRAIQKGKLTKTIEQKLFLNLFCNINLQPNKCTKQHYYSY